MLTRNRRESYIPNDMPEQNIAFDVSLVLSKLNFRLSLLGKHRYGTYLLRVHVRSKKVATTCVLVNRGLTRQPTTTVLVACKFIQLQNHKKNIKSAFCNVQRSSAQSEVFDTYRSWFTYFYVNQYMYLDATRIALNDQEKSNIELFNRQSHARAIHGYLKTRHVSFKVI